MSKTIDVKLVIQAVAREASYDYIISPGVAGSLTRAAIPANVEGALRYVKGSAENRCELLDLGGKRGVLIAFPRQRLDLLSISRAKPVELHDDLNSITIPEGQYHLLELLSEIGFKAGIDLDLRSVEFNPARWAVRLSRANAGKVLQVITQLGGYELHGRHLRSGNHVYEILKRRMTE